MTVAFPAFVTLVRFLARVAAFVEDQVLLQPEAFAAA